MAIIKDGVLIKVEKKDLHLGKYEIPSGVTEIGQKAFIDVVQNLKKVKIPEGVVTIGDCAFANCSIRELVLPESVRHIGPRAFAGAKLKNVTLNEGLLTINKRAFASCCFKQINIPKSVKVIGDCAFEHGKLKKIESFPEDAMFVDDSAFMGNDINQDVLENIKKIGLSLHERFLFCRDIDFSKVNLNNIEPFFEYLQNANLKLPIEIMQNVCDENGNIDMQRLKFFQKTMKGLDTEFDSYELKQIIKFAYVIGCLSEDPKLNQKANEWLKKLCTN